MNTLARRMSAAVLAASACALDAPAGPITLPAIFDDGVVLQRDARAAIWGTADPGAEIMVAIAGNRTRTRADHTGSWHLSVPPLPAGGPHRLTVTDGTDTVLIKDVLFGDVWICAGQSNMGWRINQSDGGDEAAAAPEDDGLRLFTVARNQSETPQRELDGRWEPANTDSRPRFSAVGYWFGEALRAEIGVPVGLVAVHWGGTPVEAWTPQDALRADERLAGVFERERAERDRVPALQASYDAELAAWEAERAQAEAAGRPAPAKPRQPNELRPWRDPGVLYNGMVAPIAGMTAKGVLWYQGESNTAYCEEYDAALGAMVAAWRRAFDNESLPFAIVQLPNRGAVQKNPADNSGWAGLRAAQAELAQRTPGVDLVPIIEFGDPDDVHPTNKKPVAERLAAWALDRVYAAPRDWRGPTLLSVEPGRGVLRLRFDEPVRTTDGTAPKGLALAGPDGRFFWADARIDGPVVTLRSDRVPEPVSARYGWGATSIGNLTDSEGRHAAPFATDDWRAWRAAVSSD